MYFWRIDHITSYTTIHAPGPGIDDPGNIVTACAYQVPTSKFENKMSLLPPAQPAYVLRGHAAQIHAVCFMRANSRLVTGDADGWVVIWSLVTKRPVAVWRAHEGTLLGARSWGEDKLITCVSMSLCLRWIVFFYIFCICAIANVRCYSHGKDYKLIVWKFSEADEPSMSVVLPVDTPPEPRKQPWVLHIIMVNTMNFCSFAQCDVTPPPEVEEGGEGGKTVGVENELLIAVPNTQSSETVRFTHAPLALVLFYSI